MTYPIAGGKTFNMVLSHVDWTDPSTWDSKTAVAEMRACFGDWDPRLVWSSDESLMPPPMLSLSHTKCTLLQVAESHPHGHFHDQMAVDERRTAINLDLEKRTASHCR